MTIRIGAAAIAPSPPAGAPLAGHGPSGLAAKIGAPLFARAIVMESDDGARCAICVADLLSGTPALRERVAARTDAIGLGRDRIVIAGTHTHHGPGGLFGDTLYDRLASSRPGARPALVERVADAIAEAIERAAERMKPASVGYGEVPLWGVARNAALGAFARNPEASRWGDAGMPGHGAPPSLDEARRSIDPRVRVIAAFDDRGEPIASLALFAAHATALSGDDDAFDPDWPGVACAIVESRSGGVSLIGAGPTGDTNVMDDALVQDRALRDRVGERVGSSITEAIAIARDAASRDATLDARFDEIHVAETPGLAPWCFGATAMGGSEDGRSPFYRLIGPTRTSAHFPPDHPQHPKAPALGRAGGWVGRAFHLEAPPSWPVHAIRLGSTVLVTVPGEPTITTAHRIERAILEHAHRVGVRHALVIGCAGAYAGYFTTAEEYAEQAYEGASTLHGRESASRLMERLAAMLG